MKIFKVYCGKNGKWYSYKVLARAQALFDSLVFQNYHTILEVVENGNVERLKEFI